MPKVLLLAPVFLAACAAAAPQDSPGPPQPIPVHGVTSGHKCRTEGTDRFIGQKGTRDAARQIMRVSKAAVLRWAPPGTMLTMDFREDRVTIYVGDDGKITKISCG